MTMNEKDKQAFKEWYKQQIWGNASWEDGVFEGFEFGLEHRDKQAEPVGEVTSGMAQNGSQCFKPYGEDALTVGAKLYTSAPAVAVDHRGLIKRIDAAIDRVTQGRGLMSIPADPRSDVDLVLCECKALLEGENPPFWATQFHPVQPEKKMLVCCPQCKLVFDGKSNRLNSEAQPVQPAVSVNEQMLDTLENIEKIAWATHNVPNKEGRYKWGLKTIAEMSGAAIAAAEATKGVSNATD